MNILSRMTESNSFRKFGSRAICRTGTLELRRETLFYSEDTNNTSSEKSEDSVKLIECPCDTIKFSRKLLTPLDTTTNSIARGSLKFRPQSPTDKLNVEHNPKVMLQTKFKSNDFSKIPYTG